MKAPASKTAKVRPAPAKASSRSVAKPAASKPAVKAVVKAKAVTTKPAAKQSSPKKPAAAATKVAPAKKAAPAGKTAVKAVPAKKAAPAAKAVAVKKAAVSQKVAAAPVAAKPAPKKMTRSAATAKAAAPVRPATSPAAAGQVTMHPKDVPVPAPVAPAAGFALAPDAAKATFTPINERTASIPVTMTVQKDPKRANNWKNLPVEQLTDQDVLAMPDSEYMNDVQLAFFKRKLEQLKADMLANAGETTEHLREDTVVVPDPADRATIEEEHALELRTRDRERKLLKKIEQAIARIDSGDYGYCEETGEPIGVGRLMARPTASLSLEAQQRRELKQKLFGD